MQWLAELWREASAAQTVLVLSVVAALGLALGHVRVRGVGLGVAGVLFAGLAIGHLLGATGVSLDEHVMAFVREFGLILFVYAVGMQVGPGFLGSLRREGLPLNLLAAGVVVLGVLLTVGLVTLAGVEPAAAVGLYSGAVTNTPSLAAAQEALKAVPGADPATLALPGMGYAIAYPFGIVGIILTMLLVRGLGRIDIQQEAAALERASAAEHAALSGINLEVTNPNLDGVRLGEVPVLREGGVTISRLLRGGRVIVPGPHNLLALGDVVHAVGTAEALAQARMVIGRESAVDVKAVSSDPAHRSAQEPAPAIESRRIIVTRPGALGKRLEELALAERYGVTVTRVNRSEIDLPPRPGLKLQYADRLLVVGTAEGLRAVSAELGDAQQELHRPRVLPIFLGIALGVLVGSVPLAIPGAPGAVKLGLAGGPLLVAIVLSRLSNVGPLVWYLPISANTLLRELGIVLFLGTVGLRSGAGFLDTLLAGDGLYWLGLGAVVTLVPLLAAAAFGRLVWKLNYLSLCGLLAGSCTDPPALAFAQTIAGNNAPAVSYATVYPLVMILRVVSGQLLVMFLAG